MIHVMFVVIICRTGFLFSSLIENIIEEKFRFKEISDNSDLFRIYGRWWKGGGVDLRNPIHEQISRIQTVLDVLIF